MKKLLFIFLTLSLISFGRISYAQLPLIKKNVSELFFDFVLNPSKFDVRKKFQSDKNFYGFDDGLNYGEYETITAKFYSNYKTSYLASKEMRIIFWFDTGNEVSHSRKITTDFTIDEYEKCLKQVQEIYSIFSKCSYKTQKVIVDGFENQKVGEGWCFYSSDKTFKKVKPYLKVSYRYFIINKSEYMSEYKGYVFEIILDDNNVY